MIILSWNCRGLGNPWIVQVLNWMVRTKKPNLVFLMETKLNSKKMEAIQTKLDFDAIFVVDSIGKSGGLALMWKLDNVMNIQNYSRWNINVVIQTDSTTKEWKFSGFYGHPEVAKRPEHLLRHLAVLAPNPWLGVGDFNEITSANEKSSRTYRPRGQMQAFRSALADSGLADLGFHGPKFTWYNGRSEGDLTLERLDRVVANLGWTEIFNVVEVSVLARVQSDHHPLLVEFSSNHDIKWPKHKRFRYEASWTKQKEHKEIIKKEWKKKITNLSPWATIQSKLSGCRRSLKQWVWKQVHLVEEKIQQKEHELKEVQMQASSETEGKGKLVAVWVPEF